MPLYEKIKSHKEILQHGEGGQDTVLLLQKIREKLLEEAQRNRLMYQNSEIVREKVQKLLDSILMENGKFLPKEEKEKLYNQAVQDITGLGPIQPLVSDESVSEIMVNGAKQVYVERNGKIELTPVFFINDEHVMQIVDKIISPLGRRLDENNPMVDARLPDGSRVNAIIPPLSMKGPIVTIRKFKRDSISMQQLLQLGTLNKEMAAFLEIAVQKHFNILVAGGTGSGKTTLLNVLGSFIPENERIITIEDAAELKLLQPHVVSLETRPSNIEGKGEITIRDLVRNSLRMRPDRIIVGEVRSGEALDMLQAMNTGHSGSLSTIHANTPRDALSRLETLTLMAGFDLPLKAIRDQIAAAIDLVIQIRRFSDGSRKITYISHVEGTEADIITLQDLFIFEETRSNANGTIKGNFVKLGILPEFKLNGGK